MKYKNVLLQSLEVYDILLQWTLVLVVRLPGYTPDDGCGQ